MKSLCIVVDVKQSDIDNGVRESTSDCPLALAMKRQCEYFLLTVNETPGGEVYTWRGDWEKRLLMSRAAVRFAELFDSGQSVRPSRFRLKLIEQHYDPSPLDWIEDHELSGYGEGGFGDRGEGGDR